MVKSLTNDILVPADAEMTLEGYLDERGYVEPEGPYGEYMGYYGSIHLDPVFHCTAVTMRRDVLHHTLLHGSARVLDQTDSTNITALRTEAEAMQILNATVREPVAACSRSLSGGSNTLRVSIRQHAAGEARVGDRGAVRRHHAAQARLRVRRGHRHSRRRPGRVGARDPLPGGPGPGRPHRHEGHDHGPVAQRAATGAKSGFDCTRPFGRAGEIPLTRSAAKIFAGPARFQTVELALADGPMFYADIVEAIGSDDGREVACALDALRQSGRLGRDRDGRYHLGRFEAGRHRHRRRALPRSERGDVRF